MKTDFEIFVEKMNDIDMNFQDKQRIQDFAFRLYNSSYNNGFTAGQLKSVEAIDKIIDLCNESLKTK
tara:strand:- start:726 stop:926 length:201 start_codon:yes stop_codon:yes gene_type:complete